MGAPLYGKAPLYGNKAGFVAPLGLVNGNKAGFVAPVGLVNAAPLGGFPKNSFFGVKSAPAVLAPKTLLGAPAVGFNKLVASPVATSFGKVAASPLVGTGFGKVAPLG